MHPWLLDFHLPLIGRVAVSSYFFFLMLGCVAATEVAISEARRSGVPPRQVLAISVVSILAGILGARAGHFVFVAREALLSDPLAFFRVWEGGMVFYGGLLGGAAAAAAACRRTGLPFLRLADVVAGPIMLGLAFGRMGCLSAGCCYGRPIDWGSGIEWPWAVTFLQGQVPAALRGVPLHPTQAYSSLCDLGIFLLVLRLRRRQRFDGQATGVLLVAYGIARSVIELFRLDLGRRFWFEETLGQAISTSQGISIPLVLVGIALLVRGFRASAAGAAGR